MLAAATQLTAVPITGKLDLSGAVTLDTNNLATATKVVQFGVTSPTVVPVTVQAVTAGSVLDSTINPGDAVAMSFPWTFGAGLNNLWSVGGFTFNLVSSAIVVQNASFLAVQGKGFITGAGYESTAADWYFTTQGSGDNMVFSFSATSKAVPDGGSTALLVGAALLAVGVIARRRGFAL